MAASDIFILYMLLVLSPYIIWFIIVICLAYWVYGDAKKHGMDAGIWALVTFFGGIIGIIVYFLMREEHKKPKMMYMPVGYYPVPMYAPPPTYGPGAYQPPPPSTNDFVCPDCGNRIRNPYNSQSLFCDRCGGTHKVR